MSSHISATYGVPCEKCGAKSDEPCRSLTTRRVTDTHLARRNAYGMRLRMYPPSNP